MKTKPYRKIGPALALALAFTSANLCADDDDDQPKQCRDLPTHA
jgi:hypothetical protein